MIVIGLSVSSCGLTGGLPRDWTETDFLVASRAEFGSYSAAGHDLMVAGEYELALRAYTRAIDEEGLSGAVLGGLAAANLQLNRLGQARSFLERALRIAPDSPSVWNNLGILLAVSGDREAAREAFSLAQSLVPGEQAQIAANLALVSQVRVPDAHAQVSLPLRHSSGLYVVLEQGSDEDRPG